MEEVKELERAKRQKGNEVVMHKVRKTKSKEVKNVRKDASRVGSLVMGEN